MKKEPGLTTGVSETDKVNEFMDDLKYPLSDVAVYLRQLILCLGVDKTTGEGISWNAPVFCYTGKMKPFNAKE